MRTQIDVAEIDAGNVTLQSCADETRMALIERGHFREFEDDSYLYRRGDSAGVVLALLQGTLQMEKTSSRGRRQVMCTVTPVECGGLCMLLLGDQSLADVHALESGQLVVLDRQAFQELAGTDQTLCQAGWRAAAHCMAHLSELVEHLSFHKVAQRVALTLVENTHQDGDLIRMTQADLAAEVGTTREVVARCLAGLQTAGAVRLGRGRITVVQRDKLRQAV